MWEQRASQESIMVPNVFPIRIQPNVSQLVTSSSQLTDSCPHSSRISTDFVHLWSSLRVDYSDSTS